MTKAIIKMNEIISSEKSDAQKLAEIKQFVEKEQTVVPIS